MTPDDVSPTKWRIAKQFGLWHATPPRWSDGPGVFLSWRGALGYVCGQVRHERSRFGADADRMWREIEQVTRQEPR